MTQKKKSIVPIKKMIGGLCVMDMLVDNNSSERINFVDPIRRSCLHLSVYFKVNTRALLMIQPRKLFDFCSFQTFDSTIYPAMVLFQFL